MIPIKLTMSAFAAYAHEQVIDFRELGGENIFIISGPTGAGKTTIFDAISYALYGDASGESRDQESLRSHFATLEQSTYVEFEFEIRGEHYSVKRYPEQEQKKKRGEGTTIVKPEAELILPDGKMVTKVKNVTEKITEILGINKEQFKQIVMLPQGEFKKLLLASSEEREKIFRKIFNTYAFERIQKQLKEKALMLNKEQERSRQQIKGMLQNIKIEPAIPLEEAIDYKSVFEQITDYTKAQEKEYKLYNEKVQQLEKEAEKYTKEKVEAKQINDLLKEKEQILDQAKALEEQKEAYKQKELLLLNIQKAEPITFIEKTCAQRKQELEEVTLAFQQSKALIEDYQKQSDEAKKAYEEEKNNEPKRKQLTIEIAKLNELVPIINSYDNVIQAAKKIEKIYNEESGELEKINLQVKQLKEQFNDKEEELKKMQQLEVEKTEVENLLENEKRYYSHIGRIYRQVEEYEKLKKQYDQQKEGYTAIDKAYKQIKHEYETKDEIYKKEQAGILATTLQDGIPCPVCGSLEHPNPAIGEMENVPTKEELKELKGKLELATTKQEKALQSLTDNHMAAQKSLEVVNSLLGQDANVLGLSQHYHEAIKQEVLQKGQIIGKNKKDLEQKKQALVKKLQLREELSASVIKLKEQVEGNVNRIENLQHKQKESYGNLLATQAKKEALEKQIPKEIEGLKVLNQRIEASSKQLESSKEQLRVKEELQDTKNKQLQAETSRNKELKMQAQKMQQVYKDLIEEFNNSMIESGFEDEKEYGIAKSNIVYKEDLKNEIEQYMKLYEATIARKKDRMEKTKDLKVIAIHAIDEKIAKVADQKQQELEKAKSVYSILENNTNGLKAMQSIYANIEEKEEAYKVIGELSEVSNGNKRPYVSFERYVLASYFDEIIGAANIRLKKMTSNRFELRRRTTVSKGKNQKGLELQVYDTYTTTERGVGSLSGGESFKASLALALGLSDIVQSAAGGICLQTMFIDEGFGTLDPQSLDSAIDCLLQLQEGGRLVGIISHVEELKEKIRAKLEVQVSHTGSTAKFEVV